MHSAMRKVTLIMRSCINAQFDSSNAQQLCIVLRKFELERHSEFGFKWIFKRFLSPLLLAFLPLPQL